MQAKTVIAFEYEKEDRMYRLMMPDQAPLGEAYDAACAFQGELARIIKEHNEKKAEPEPEVEEESPKEE